MIIGILQTDSVMDRFRTDFGDYPQMFGQLLQGAASRDIAFRVVDCQAMDYPAPDSCDAYIITGSRNSVYEDELWIKALAEFVDKLLAARRKLVGICFGHQLVAHFFGGRTRAVGWAVGVQQCTVVENASWMRPSLTDFALLSSHKDQVVELPAGARLLISSEFCPVSGYAIGDQVFTLQGHPEFSKPYSRELMTMRRELLGTETFERGIESLTQETHEPEVAQWIANFINQ